MLLLSADFFQNYLFQTNLSETLSECQTGSDQNRHSVDPDLILSALIWVQTVCKTYQPMTKVASSKEIINLKSKA